MTKSQVAQTENAGGLQPLATATTSSTKTVFDFWRTRSPTYFRPGRVLASGVVSALAGSLERSETAFSDEMRSLERNIAHGSGSRSSIIMAALKDLPPGIIRIIEDRCEFIPGAPTAQPTRSKTARVSQLQRRARLALVLAGDGTAITRAQPVAEQHEASEYVYIPADFHPPR